MDKKEHEHLHELGIPHVHGKNAPHKHKDGAERLRENAVSLVHDHGEPYLHEGTEFHVHDSEEHVCGAHSHDGHHHVHSEEEKKAVLNRLSRAIGHLQSIRTMVEEDRDCSEILIQLSAVKSAVNNTGKLVLKEHIAHCIVEAIESGDEESLRQLNKAIDSFVK